MDADMTPLEKKETLFKGSVIRIYTGPMPEHPDDEPKGHLFAVIDYSRLN